jgi:hypothetical protein
MLENGDYRAKASRGALGLAGNGTEQVGVEFDLLDKPGNKLTWYGYFTEKGTDIALRGLRTAGWKGTDLSDLSSLSDPEVPEVILVVEQETYEGKTRPKVKFINSTGGLAMRNALDEGSGRRLRSRRGDSEDATPGIGRRAPARPLGGAGSEPTGG